MDATDPVLNLNENDILEAFHNGQERVFNAIYTAFSRALYDYCKAIVNHKAEAEDIVTETFVKLYENAKSINSLDSLRGFLYTTGHRLCMNNLRDRRRKSGHHQKIMQLADSIEEPVIPCVIRAEHRRSLDEAIALLPQKRQYIIYQMIANGKTVQELAIELNMSEHAVRSAKSKAIHFLREIFGRNDMAGILIIICILLIAIELMKKILFF